jgi:V/A-type H+/Na+-transporting ATPase subunit D
MSVLQVNPTRMSLMDLKRRTVSATRGHKLLKDKQDGLMKSFLAIIRDAKRLRGQVEQELGHAFKSFLLASAWMSDAQMGNALSSPQANMELTVETKNVMSVRIPVFKLDRQGSVRTYGYAGTNALLDSAVDAFELAFDTLIKLAEIEKQAENMAIELETTRRRVNALQYKMIPDLKDTVKYIRMKLDEAERGAIIGTMRVKAQIQAQEEGAGLAMIMAGKGAV